MKNQIKIDLQHLIGKLLLIIAIICFSGIIHTSEAQSVRSRLKVEYLKKADDSKVLTAKLLLRQGRRYVPVPGLTVDYSVLNGEEEVILGTGLTDANGEAMLIISPDYKLPENENRFTVLSASFAGNDSTQSASSEIEIKDVTIDVELGDKESKLISVSVTELNEEGNYVPVADEYLSISIDRLFSLLPVGDGTTDSLGVFEFVYEDEIPGDEDGDVGIVVKLEDSALYGTVETMNQAKWGTPVDYTVDVSARALWSDQAPLWMLIATFIVLVGAWFNFGLAIFNLMKVKKAGK